MCMPYISKMSLEFNTHLYLQSRNHSMEGFQKAKRTKYDESNMHNMFTSAMTVYSRDGFTKWIWSIEFNLVNQLFACHPFPRWAWTSSTLKEYQLIAFKAFQKPQEDEWCNLHTTCTSAMTVDSRDGFYKMNLINEMKSIEFRPIDINEIKRVWLKWITRVWYCLVMYSTPHINKTMSVIK